MNQELGLHGSLGFNSGMTQQNSNLQGYSSQFNQYNNEAAYLEMLQRQQQAAAQTNYLNSTPSTAKPTDDRLLVLLTED